MFLSGEWVHSNLLFAASFLVAGAGCFGLGAYVVMKDRQNRALMEEETLPEALAVETGPDEPAPATQGSASEAG